ncbi:MAG TPA: branched-chain amino acid ABC transporter permease [Burkholderiaceae bacterium]
MQLLFELLLFGLTLGGLYAMVAMGLTLQYGVARIMNLAYGELLIGAAFATYAAFTALQLSPLFALVLAFPLGFALNWLVYRLLLSPLVRRTQAGPALEVDSLLATFGLLFVVQGVMLVMFGGGYHSYSYAAEAVVLFGARIAENRLIMFAFTVVVGAVLYLFLTRTRVGSAVRAVATAPNHAALVGIDVAMVSAFIFAAGGALVAAGGVLASMFLTFSASMGVIFTMKALIVVIMGGVGNVVGCVIAGLLLGLSETVVARLVDPGLTLAVNYLLFLAVLLWRPAGLFGRPAR